MEEIHSKMCLFCKKEFNSSSLNARFCKGKCNYYYNRYNNRTKKMITLKCFNCGRLYNSHINKAKRHFCSRKCWDATIKSKREIKCPVCKKKFFRYGSYLKKYQVRCCSAKCRVEYDRKNPFFAKKSCLECGKTVIGHNRGNKKFCSNSCGNKYRKRTGITIRGKQLLKKCEYCGKEFYCNSSNTDRKLCSRKCADGYTKISRTVYIRSIKSLNQFKCKHCKKEFLNKDITRVYCGRKCFIDNKRRSK